MTGIMSRDLFGSVTFANGGTITAAIWCLGLAVRETAAGVKETMQHRIGAATHLSNLGQGVALLPRLMRYLCHPRLCAAHIPCSSCAPEALLRGGRVIYLSLYYKRGSLNPSYDPLARFCAGKRMRTRFKKTTCRGDAVAGNIKVFAWAGFWFRQKKIRAHLKMWSGKCSLPPRRRDVLLCFLLFLRILYYYSE